MSENASKHGVIDCDGCKAVSTPQRRYRGEREFKEFVLVNLSGWKFEKRFHLCVDCEAKLFALLWSRGENGR